MSIQAGHVRLQLVYTEINSQRGQVGVIITRVKSGNFGHQVNSDIRLQTVEIQMSRLIRIFTVCLDNLFFHSSN